MTKTPPNSNPVGTATAFGGTYGGSKTGKTTDILYSLPRAFYIATPAALKPSIATVGFQLHPSQVREVERISEATKILKDLGPEFDAIVCDDLSLLAEKTMSVLERTKSGFKLFGALRDEVLEFRDVARTCGKHVVWTCHTSPPSVKNGWPIRGGPRLPGRLPEDLPAQCDFVLRTFYEPSRSGPWKMVYRCDPADVGYISGDRHGVTPDMAPMNLGEIMRAAKYPIRRAPNLDWMEAVVERGAVALLNNPPEKEIEVLRAMRAFVEQSFTREPTLLVWVLRDARDRAALRHAKTRHLDAFFETPTPAGFAPLVFAPGVAGAAPAAPEVGQGIVAGPLVLG